MNTELIQNNIGSNEIRVWSNDWVNDKSHATEMVTDKR